MAFMLRSAVPATIFLVSLAASAQRLNGNYTAEISPPMMEPMYERASIHQEGSKLSGTWGADTLTGEVDGASVKLELAAPSGAQDGSLSGQLQASGAAGSGTLALRVRRFGAMRPGANTPRPVEWTLAQEAAPPAKPREIDYQPKTFFSYYSAANKPDLRIFPGDIVHTSTPDAGGVDLNGKQVARGSDASIGPIYIEGALPGDTLVVHLLKVRTNRATARQGSRISAHASTLQYDEAAKYDPAFDSEYQLDAARNIARLAHPTPHLAGYWVPIKPMLGCISVAPPGEEARRGTDLGAWGGNMDYNGNGEGTTIYLPVFHPGALFGFGDGHAAMGDGEVTGAALETSMDVTFSTELIKGSATAQPRAETGDYLISFGIAPTVGESIQLATSQLADWIKKDYGLTDSEVALFLGAYLKYDVTELVDPQYNVAAKVPKSALATLAK